MPRRQRGYPSLTSGLAAYWPLCEPALVRNDVYGVRHLTDNNTVTSAAGPGGPLPLAGSFAAATSESLSHADHAKLRASTGKFSVCAWAWLTTKPTNGMGIVSKIDFIVSTDYLLSWNNTNDRFEFTGTADGSALTTCVGNNFGAPVLATWNFVCGRYDGVNLRLSVNGSKEDTQALDSQHAGTTAGFRIGSTLTLGSASTFWNGRIAGVGFWQRCLSEREVKLLYNGGIPRIFPFRR